MTVNEYKLPDVGEGLTEAEIVTWMVKVGDTIKVNDVVVEIETAKSLVELPSPYAGTITALLVEEGVTVAVGTPIIAVDDGKAGSPAVEPPADDPRQPAGPAMDLSNPAAGAENADAGRLRPQVRARRCAGPVVGRRPRAPTAGSATQMQVQGSFGLGVRDTSEVVPGDEEPVPAVAARDARVGADRSRAAPGRSARCWPSRRCASSPASSASTWRR